MNENQSSNTSQDAFDLVAREGRIVRTARMLDESKRLEPNQRKDISERVLRFIQEHGITQASVAREVGIGHTTVSEVLRHCYKGNTSDKQLVKLHNWLELAARRENIVHSRKFVVHSVAAEILQVAGVVAETCTMGVVYGPARIGKTLTLKAIEGDQRFGDPVLITVNESTVRPFALCRRICQHFKLSTSGTFDRVFARLVERLKNTKKMLMFDECDLASYPALEMIRQLHDATGCPVLFSGKPAVYEHLGLRDLGAFSEKLDQMAGRIVMKRDLTARTRCRCGSGPDKKCTCKPEPLYSLADIRKHIKQADLKLHVDRNAEMWLQRWASALGTGGIGNALICLYLAYKLAFVQGHEAITAAHLEQVAELTMGHEDAERIAEVVADASGMRRVV